MPEEKHLTTSDIGVTVEPAGGSTSWSPTAMFIGGGVLNGAVMSNNSGAGNYLVFSPSSDDEILFNVALPRNGLDYDGSDIAVVLDWMKFGDTGGTVVWELDYAFVELGDDAYSKLDGTLTNSVDVTAVVDQTLIEETFAVISGPAGAKILQLTLRRNSVGTGADTYTGDAELYGFNLTI